MAEEKVMSKITPTKERIQLQEDQKGPYYTKVAELRFTHKPLIDLIKQSFEGDIIVRTKSIRFSQIFLSNFFERFLFNTVGVSMGNIHVFINDRQDDDNNKMDSGIRKFLISFNGFYEEKPGKGSCLLRLWKNSGDSDRSLFQLYSCNFSHDYIKVRGTKTIADNNPIVFSEAGIEYLDVVNNGPQRRPASRRKKY